MSASSPKGALLVGSVPLADSEQVFRAAVEILGDRLRRVPDGETGDRTNWIGWQFAVMAQTPGIERVPTPDDAYTSLPSFRLAGSADEIAFGNLGYADAALASWAVFQRLQADGVIPAHVKFQVSLPTPLAPVTGFVTPEDQAAVEGPYEQRLMHELGQILDAIPHDRLAIQWDVAVEFGILERTFPSFLWELGDGMVDSIVERLIRYAGQVPEDVELGIHLCYGDAGHKHFKEPEDTSLLVEVANKVSAGVSRPIAWLHLPVPRDRDDDAYFAPLENLELHPETELYLGLVHYTDGVDGTQRRIEAADRHTGAFGVATECGFGRRPSETVRDLLQIHADVSSPIEANAGGTEG